MSADLPPIGSRVRTTAGDVGTVDEHAGDGLLASIRWPLGGGMWVTADEIEEVLP